MSNDQSPPVRKIIPYKKSGQRKSPFAEMAFQFTGTALDVAIQQREQGEEETAQGEITAQEQTEEAPGPEIPPDAQVEAPKAVTPLPVEPPLPPVKVEEQASKPFKTNTVKPQIRQRKQPARKVRIVSERRIASATDEETPAGLQAFITRWEPFLTETQIGICTYIYNNSMAVGEEYCFTSTPRLMAAVSKTERQIKTVLNQLMDWGFLAKGETIVNTPREQRGTYYKLLIDKA